MYFGTEIRYFELLCKRRVYAWYPACFVFQWTDTEDSHINACQIERSKSTTKVSLAPSMIMCVSNGEKIGKLLKH
jgi:hypothetical protein